jgi:hypothetical protein
VFVLLFVSQDAQGRPVEVWSICGRDEEPLVLQQFLRFGETRVIASRILQQHENETKSSAAAAAAATSASSGSEQQQQRGNGKNNNKESSSEREQQQQQQQQQHQQQHGGVGQQQSGNVSGGGVGQNQNGPGNNGGPGNNPNAFNGAVTSSSSGDPLYDTISTMTQAQSTSIYTPPLGTSLGKSMDLTKS